MAKFSYQPKGVCSVQIDFEVEDGVVRNVHFTRGCNGNTQGISALVEGMNIDDVISRLKGTNCNGRGTSCPDQLAIALEQKYVIKIIEPSYTVYKSVYGGFLFCR